MKITSIIILAMCLLLVGCLATDPMPEDLYTKNLYPARNNRFDIGSARLSYDEGYFKLVHGDEIYLGGVQLLIPAYGEIYATGVKVIELALADTPYLYDGVTSTGEMLGFSNNGLGRLTSDDVTNNRVCLLNTALTVSVDAADVPAVIRCYIYKNGIADPASLVGDYFIIGDTVEALPIVCLIKLLNSGDYIELYLESSVNNATVTVATMTLIATTVD